jgi:hypothetical protein
MPWWLWGAGLILFIGIGGGVIIYAGQKPRPAPVDAFPFGAVASCRTVPAFARSLGFDDTSVMDTQSSTKGLVIFQPGATANDPPSRQFQDITWDDAGYLGPLTTDKLGNIYVAPAPHISMLDNPPSQANTIFKVDASTGKLAPLVDLPRALPPTQQNSFGLMGLAYDCDTHSLYATSVAGSKPMEELGRIFRIDLGSGQITSTLEKTDAFGLAVFNGVSGKRLYFGSARASEVRSVALSTKGDFAGVPRVEFSMAGWGVNGDDKARRIIFNVDNSMLIRGMPFDFNLIASSGRPQTDYQMRYDPNADTWRPAGSQ